MYGEEVIKSEVTELCCGNLSEINFIKHGYSYNFFGIRFFKDYIKIAPKKYKNLPIRQIHWTNEKELTLKRGNIRFHF